MNTETRNNTIIIDKNTVQRQGGVVILPIEKWQEIEAGLEDLEMHNSKKLAQEIAERRQEKETIPLEEILDKHDI